MNLHLCGLFIKLAKLFVQFRYRHLTNHFPGVSYLFFEFSGLAIPVQFVQRRLSKLQFIRRHDVSVIV